MIKTRSLLIGNTACKTKEVLIIHNKKAFWMKGLLHFKRFYLISVFLKTNNPRKLINTIERIEDSTIFKTKSEGIIPVVRRTD